MSPKQPSKVEAIKQKSRNLRGTIAESLADDAPGLPAADAQLLKFHGSYQQYDRDTATQRKRQGETKAHRYMVRLKIPAGRLDADQYLAIDDLARRLADGTLRLTTRQDIQLYGVVKANLKATLAEINRVALTTLGACGDIVRNVVTTAAPVADAVHRRLQADARALSEALLPQGRAYHEIWLDGERLEPDAPGEPEPLYGATYLPRKFKIALATPHDNTADVLTNDLGILALFEGDRLLGYNVMLGGGLGMTHNNPRTYPRLASPVAFVEPDALVAAARAVVALQRDHGDRSDRRHARLKYLIEERGVDWAKAMLEDYLGRPLEPPRAMPPLVVPDHLGWHEQGDGRCWLGLPVPSGRIADSREVQLASAVRTVVARHRCTPVITADQNLLLADLPADARADVEATLRRHGVRLADDLTPARRWAMACPALPSCSLALTEAERVKDRLVSEIEEALARHGVADERLSIRITGCPNGCARPYAGDIGIVGRVPGAYALFVGGDFEGTRLNAPLADRVRLDSVAATLEPLFAAYAAGRYAGESFGDFCHRFGPPALRIQAGLAEQEDSDIAAQ